MFFCNEWHLVFPTITGFLRVLRISHYTFPPLIYFLSFSLKGEILITISTDIGWSPYFPLLGGVVTELGGLISHGAVVAREYGLPCVVGAAGATSAFQTGTSSVFPVWQKIKEF